MSNLYLYHSTNTFFKLLFLVFCVLQSQENDELRDAHEKRKERLQMLQTNYRAVKEQLKQWEEASGT